MESKDNKGLTWSFIINRCFEGEEHTKMKTCYDTKSDELLRKVRLLASRPRQSVVNHSFICGVMQNVAKRQSLRVPWVPYVSGFAFHCL
jgi:hypothetical protein